MPSHTLLPLGTRVSIRSRGYVPHWEVDNGFYFITYRLADSLPRPVIEQLRRDYAAAKRGLAAGDKLTLPQRSQLSEWFQLRLDDYLDRGVGACHLRVPSVAECVIETWRRFDRQRYDLLAWCVMPNHVHVIAQLFEGGDLDAVLHSWKSYTSNAANKILKRSGTFWWREYYDHCIRDDAELSRSIRYVLENPAKAGLTDWPYMWSAGW